MESSSGGSEKINRLILQVKHLPSNFSQRDCCDFLKTYGAYRVTFYDKKLRKYKATAFAFFKNGADSAHALKELHQLQVLNSRLFVSYVSQKANIPLVPPIFSEELNTKDFKEDLICKLHSICPELGVNYVLNPMLRYKYPDVNETIISNIASELRKNKSFYVQVLHLMNKMNLDVPFEDKGETFVRNTRVLVDNFSQVSEESELSTDDEDVGQRRKRARRVATLPNVKTRKPKQLVPDYMLNVKKDLQEKEAFESVLNKRKIKISNVGESTVSDESCTINEEGFGKLLPIVVEEEPVEELERFPWSNPNFTNIETLEMATPEQMSELSAFRNYDPGDPCVKLYVKNIDKHVTVDTLFSAFGQFAKEDEAHRMIFDIKLMDKGRMKGQAFITYADVDSAEKALNRLHGRKLNTKFLSISFARSPAVT